jgi:threonine dehydrogenase-like Zn-dependent dehydrogenase
MTDDCQKRSMMQVVIFKNEIQVAEREVPVAGRHEALIKVRVAGICNTDVEITQGYMDFHGILGHEFVGEVVNCNQENWIGKRVVGEINLGCGECKWCKTGMSRHCPDRTVLGISGRDGVHAEFTALPLENLHQVPASMPDSRAVFTEPLAAAVEITQQIRIDPDWRVLIVGDGKLAILIARVLVRICQDVSAAGINPKKLNLFQSSGVKTFGRDEDPGSDYDMVVEASGSPEGWTRAVAAVKPRGVVVLKSTYHGEPLWNPAPLVINEITVVGSRCGLFPPALRLLEDSSFETDDIIEAIYPIDRAKAAFERSMGPDSMKVLLGMVPIDELSGFSEVLSRQDSSNAW